MINELLAKRAAAFDSFKALADKPTLTEEETTQYNELHRSVQDLDGQITRQREAQALAARTAQPVAGQETPASVPAAPETDKYVREKSLVIGGAMKMLGRSSGIVSVARADAVALYGENHPVTRALNTSQGSAGGFIVPPDYMNEIIELLRPRAVVRAAGPRNMPMPRGTMTLPGQGSAATAGYGAEGGRIASSQQSLNSIVATYKKLTALVPVSNDMMRYADPAVDAFVRDDLVKVIALAEDQAFILGDGTRDTPRGYLSFAQGYAASQGGTAGVFLTSANSTAAAGGNFITSTSSYTLATVAAELGGAVNKLDTANVVASKRVWFMHPRSYNYLYNVQNSLGVYVYRDELSKGTLLGYPVMRTTQIGINYRDPSSNTDCSFVFLVEMDEDLLLDSMQLELAVSREGSYVDSATGATISAFQNDQTIIRAIAEHDHQLRHDAAVAVIQFVRWAPAIS
ncbi:MAG: phage major capsid protein [Novosphingobium sp.]|nr:phage major capsid protein [Novosphingobium sp.]